MKGHASFNLMIVDGTPIGYEINVFKAGGNEPIESYTAGDCASDSQVYGTGQLSSLTLLEFAKQTAEEMMQELHVYGPVIHDPDAETDSTNL